MYLDIQPMTDKERMNRAEAAAYLRLAPRTLAIWASEHYRRQHGGKTPVPFYKVGRLVQYRKADLDAFLEQGRVQ